MSRLIKILSPVGLAVLVAAGCKSLPEEDNVLTSEEVTLKASIADISTKTHLGDQTGNVIPVYWSKGDMINVNGTDSSPLSEGQCTNAEFAVRNVSAPYYAVYPASVYQSSDDSGRNASILLPETQAYSPDSFGEGAAVLYGSAGEDGNMTFQNLCGAIRVSITDDEEGVLKSFSLSTNSDEEHLSGYFSLDLQTGELEPEEVTNSVDLELPEEGVALSRTEPRSFFMTIPAGSYQEGFTITLTTSDNRTMKCEWLRESAGAEPGITVSAGKLVSFGPFVFKGIKQIVDADSWNEFATAVNTGGNGWEKWKNEDGVVCLEADIETEGDLVAINSWTGIFDGNEHTITRAAATKPLFKSVSGTVRNLNLEGSFTPATPYETAPLAGKLVSKGRLLQCSSSMDINWTGAGDVAVAAMAGSIEGSCRVEECQNSGDINVTTDCTGGARKLYVGGIVAMVGGLSDTTYVKDCINNGAIGATSRDSNNGLDGSGIGGIVGAVTSGDATNFAVISDCKNLKNITFSIKSSTTPISAAYKGVYTGGIVGLCGKVSAGVIADAGSGHVYAEIENCSNSGEVKSEGISAASSEKLYQKVYTGGIAGVAIGLQAKHISIKGCSNTGDVRSHEGGYKRASVCSNTGGLVGLGGYIDIKDCNVRATVGTIKRQSYCVGGAAAMMVTTFTMKGCTIYADLEMIQVDHGTTLNSVEQHALGVAVTSTKYDSGKDRYLHLSGSEISNCEFGGSITSGVSSAYDATTVPADIATTTFTAETYSRFIVSPKYTGSDINVFGNSFLSGN